MNQISRRAVLAGATAVIIALRMPHADAQEVKLPGALAHTPMLSGWLKLDALGHVTVFTGKGELGQGIRTALLQIASEQLDIPLSQITLIGPDTKLTPNEGYTSGSLSMKDSGTAILNATAELRFMLVEAAATKLAIPAAGLTTQNSAVVAPDGTRIPYADLVPAIALDRKASATIKLKNPATHTIIGKPTRRIDIPAKVTGGAAYVHDMRLPGMVHARMVRPPTYGATLLSLDTAAAESVPGLIEIVRNGSYLAVVTQGEWQAVQAMRLLAQGAKWSEGTPLPAQSEIYSVIRGLPSNDTVILDKKANLPTNDRTLSASFRRPYGMHAAIGPSCAVGLMEGDQITVWTHTQGVFPDRAAIADLLKMPLAKIRLIHVEGSGCYGHNGADDAAADAAMLARALPGKPVRVQWTREQENAWEPYTPAMVTEVSASLDANGKIADWQYGVWSNTHSNRPGNGARLLASWHIAEPLKPQPPNAIPQPEGGGDRNGIPLYDIANAKITSHFIPEEKLRVSAMRGLGAYTNVFTIESFIDELAEAAGADPVAFRLAHLSDPRARDVINLAAEKFGWNTQTKLPANHGRGFAFARYKNLAAYFAIALEISVSRETGEVRLIRAEVAIDSGQAVNFDGIINQTQGGVIQSASWTLFEQVTFDRTGITSRDWRGYPIMRFNAVPEQVNVHVIDHPGAPFLGTGEAAAGPTAAALANALAHATKLRMRELPLTAARVKAALNA
jgi:CO/xanthine dehydrogenase Mo-binding subunit